MAKLTFTRLLDPATGGRRTISIPGDTIGDVMAGLVEEVPQLGVHLFDPGGMLRPHVLCFVDGVSTRLEDRGAVVERESTIRFIQAVSGG